MQKMMIFVCMKEETTILKKKNLKNKNTSSSCRPLLPNTRATTEHAHGGQRELRCAINTKHMLIWTLHATKNVKIP